jgi:hypothetical protein
MGYIRESGAIPILINNLAAASPVPNANDIAIIANSALAISSLARNEMNQNDLLKANAIDTLVKLLSFENADVKRNSLLALGHLSANSAKIRAKIRSIDGIRVILGCLQNAIVSGKDALLIANAVLCVSSLSEDAADRVELTKLGGIQLLVSSLKHSDCNVLAVTGMALARCLQDGK